MHYPSICAVTLYIYYPAAASASCWMLQGLYVLPRLQGWYKRLELMCLPTNYTGRPQDTFGDKSKWFLVIQTLWFRTEVLKFKLFHMKLYKVCICHTVRWFLALLESFNVFVLLLNLSFSSLYTTVLQMWIWLNLMTVFMLKAEFCWTFVEVHKSK